MEDKDRFQCHHVTVWLAVHWCNCSLKGEEMKKEEEEDVKE